MASTQSESERKKASEGQVGAEDKGAKMCLFIDVTKKSRVLLCEMNGLTHWSIELEPLKCNYGPFEKTVCVWGGGGAGGAWPPESPLLQTILLPDPVDACLILYC